MLQICLINPKFEPSFYGYEFAFELIPDSPKAKSISGALPLLATLAGDEHQVTIIDENTAGLVDANQLKQYDVIGVTGMIVQRQRMKELLLSLQTLSAIVVVGGPYVSVDEAYFNQLADVLFIGEADATWPEFIATVAGGLEFKNRYEQETRTDMTTLPLPNYDLLDNKQYMMASIQFSRGCPFKCEFCDIIVLFGRQPRMKDPSQIIEELDYLKEVGYQHCFIVDDNFIGNKKAAKNLLRHLVKWQVDNNYAIQLSTEATINLADDIELLELFVKANILNVFIGFETPNEKALLETKKVQNIRGADMLTRVNIIRKSGVSIMGGFIVGFDSDDDSIFERQYDFISKSNISIAALTILTAIPTTPLYDRLQAEGRLRLDNALCNFEPKGLSMTALESGYKKLAIKLYEPRAFFSRVLNSYKDLYEMRQKPLAKPNWPRRLKVMKNIVLKSLSLKRPDFIALYLLIYLKQRLLQPAGKAYGIDTFLWLSALNLHFYIIYSGEEHSKKHGGIYSYTQDVADN